MIFVAYYESKRATKCIIHLFTGVLGRGILRTSPVRCSAKFAWNFPHSSAPRRLKGIAVDNWQPSEGKIAEGWMVFDVLDVMQQLGLVPDPGRA